ncbi:hypothetical protein TrRE_jg9158 [Triparma retinervis]|uniref:Uncharacterized protein n=1 Tax=Triparma retinervis TaxID=2557542 RepID=A0A9W7A619_9STRA|nr:hypothetical protein TrRE_jg9158 [Triparma retinervis]
MSYWMEMSCGKAASALFVNCIVAKLWISMYRGSMMFMSKADGKKTLESKDFRMTHMAQLNNSEYSGPLIAVLLYLHSQGVEADMACVLVVMGSIIHMWGLVILGPLGGPGLGGWTAVMGALPRYAGMFLLAIALQKCTAKDIGQFSAANIARYDRVGVPGA